jgi:predicted small secreted protein
LWLLGYNGHVVAKCPTRRSPFMARKVTVLGIAAIAAFYLIVAPTAAANTVKHSGSLVQEAGHRIATFLRALG